MNARLRGLVGTLHNNMFDPTRSHLHAGRFRGCLPRGPGRVGGTACLLLMENSTNVQHATCKTPSSLRVSSTTRSRWRSTQPPATRRTVDAVFAAAFGPPSSAGHGSHALAGPSGAPFRCGMHTTHPDTVGVPSMSASIVPVRHQTETNATQPRPPPSPRPTHVGTVSHNKAYRRVACGGFCTRPRGDSDAKLVPAVRRVRKLPSSSKEPKTSPCPRRFKAKRILWSHQRRRREHNNNHTTQGEARGDKRQTNKHKELHEQGRERHKRRGVRNQPWGAGRTTHTQQQQVQRVQKACFDKTWGHNHGATK